MATIGIGINSVLISAGETYTATAGETLSLLGYCVLSGSSTDSSGVTFSANNNYISVTGSSTSGGITTATLTAGSVNGISTLTVTSVADNSVSSYVYIEVTGGSDDGGSESEVTVSHVEVTLQGSTELYEDGQVIDIQADNYILLSAKAYLTNGETDDAGLTWSLSSNEDLVTIYPYSSPATLCIVRAGSATGTTSYPVYCRSATDSSKYIRLYFRVVSTSVNSISVKANGSSITSNAWTMLGGSTTTFTATALYADGSEDSEGVSWSLSGSGFTLSSSSTSQAVIVAGNSDATGKLTITSVSNTSVSMVVTLTAISLIDYVDLFCDGTAIADGGSITLTVGDVVTFSADAITIYGEEDSSGVTWGVNSASSFSPEISGENYIVTATAATVNSSSPGYIRAYSRLDRQKSSLCYIYVVEEPTVEITDILVSADGSSITDNTHQMSINQQSEFTAYPTYYNDDGDLAVDSAGVSWSITGDGFTLSNVDTYTSTVTAGESATTGYLVISSCTDPDMSVTITLNASVEVTGVEVTIAGQTSVIESGSVIKINSGDKIILSGQAILSNGEVDPDGVNWILSTSAGLVTIESEDSQYVHIRAGYSGGTTTSPLYCISNTDNGVRVLLYFTVTVVEAYVPYIYDGSSWVAYEVWVDQSGWVAYSSDVYPFKPYYTVNDAGADYGFELADDGYYTSANSAVHSSAAVCILTVTTSGGYNLYLDCINYAESNYDYGLLSEIGAEFVLTNTVDTTGVFHTFKSSHSADVQVVDYGELEAGTHNIYIKYRKDSSVNKNNDCLKFSVRFEPVS